MTSLDVFLELLFRLSGLGQLEVVVILYLEELFVQTAFFNYGVIRCLKPHLIGLHGVAEVLVSL